MMKKLFLALVIFWSCKTIPASYSFDIQITRISDCDRCSSDLQICLNNPNGTSQDDRCRVKKPFMLSVGDWQKYIAVNQSWQNNTLLHINVFEKGKTDTPLDRLSQHINLRPVQHGQHGEMAQSWDLNGKHWNLNLQVTLRCNQDWIGPQCDCNTKHPCYNCSGDGRKMCNPHWYGSECDVECNDDNGKGRYECAENGRKNCKKNWCNKDCNETCGKSPGTNAKTPRNHRSSLGSTPGTTTGSSHGVPGTKTKTGKVIPIIGGVAGVLLLITIGLVVFCCRKKRKHQSAGADAVPMQSSSVGHNGIEHTEGLYEEAVAVSPLYNDDLDVNTAQCSNDVYAVPDKKRKKLKSTEPKNITDGLMTENECQGSTSEAKQESPQEAGPAEDASDEVLIIDNELYG